MATCAITLGGYKRNSKSLGLTLDIQSVRTEISRHPHAAHAHAYGQAQTCGDTLTHVETRFITVSISFLLQSISIQS